MKKNSSFVQSCFINHFYVAVSEGKKHCHLFHCHFLIGFFITVNLYLQVNLI